MIQNDVNNRVQCINVDSIIKPSLVTLISVTTKFYLIGLFYVISRSDIGNQYDCWTRLFFYPNSNRIERYLSLILKNEYSNTRFLHMYFKCVYWIFDLLSCPSDWSWNTWFWMIQNDVNNRVQCIRVDSIIKPSLVTLISVINKVLPDFGWYKMTWIIGSSASELIQS